MTQDTERWTGDCGVCGVPATQWNEVCEGYSVPRCYAHAGHQAYQAESRLARAASSLQEVEAEAARWKAELWQCYLMSGADPDGDDGSHLNPGETLYEVTELRKDYDECPTPERLQEVERERDRAVAAIQADHRHKASIGGSPCVCEWCLSNPEGGTDGRP